MADFIRIEGRKSNSELIINADTIEYMYEMTDRLGNIITQITFLSGNSLNIEGQVSKFLKVGSSNVSD